MLEPKSDSRPSNRRPLRPPNRFDDETRFHFNPHPLVKSRKRSFSQSKASSSANEPKKFVRRVSKVTSLRRVSSLSCTIPHKIRKHPPRIATPRISSRGTQTDRVQYKSRFTETEFPGTRLQSISTMTNSPSFSDKCISTPSWLNRRLLDDSSEVSTTRHSRIPIRSIYSSWDETTTAALLAATTGKDDSSIDFAAISTQLGFQESTVRIRFRKAILFAVARELDPFSDEEDNRILHAGRISQQCLPSDISLMWKSLARDLQRKKSTVFTRYQNLDRCKVTQLSTNSSLRSDSPLHPPTLLLDFKAAHQIGNQISLPNTRNSCFFFLRIPVEQTRTIIEMPG